MTDRDYRFLPENEDRPVLVLGHSLGTTFSLWDPIFESLQKNFRLLFFNPHPRQMGDGDASIEARGKELIQIIEYLKLGQVDFCGVSMSGLIGQWLALEAPDRVRNLVLANTAARIGKSESWQERMNLIQEKGLAQVASDLAGRWFSNSFTTQQPDVVQTFADGLGDFPESDYLAGCQSLRDADLRERVASIKARTLIVAGRYDRAVPLTDADLLHNQIPSSRLISYPCGHLACIEFAEEFANAVSDFLLGFP